uniref:Uncharacterized protein n=1 Tax=Glossina brevipalpis TaxID=37001 RepID=A0A1A9W8A5_9MUSC
MMFNQFSQNSRSHIHNLEEEHYVNVFPIRCKILIILCILDSGKYDYKSCLDCHVRAFKKAHMHIYTFTFAFNILCNLSIHLSGVWYELVILSSDRKSNFKCIKLQKGFKSIHPKL